MNRTSDLGTHTGRPGARRRRVLPALLILLVTGAAAPAPDTAAGWIERMNQALHPTQEVSADLLLRTEDPDGKGTETRMHFSCIDSDGATELHLRTQEPEVARGILYEVVDTADEPLERSAYIPALRRVRKIFGILRTDPFLGSEFSYEDIELRAPEVRGVGRRDRVTQDGRTLILVTSDAHERYGRVETWIDPGTGLPVRVRFYDAAGVPLKEETFQTARVEGRPFPTRIEMRNLETGWRSILLLENVRLGDAERGP